MISRLRPDLRRRGAVLAATGVLLGSLAACGGAEEAPASFTDPGRVGQMSQSYLLLVNVESGTGGQLAAQVTFGSCVTVSQEQLRVSSCPTRTVELFNGTRGTVVGTLQTNPPETLQLRADMTGTFGVAGG
jgi:hypothetical protein